MHFGYPKNLGKLPLAAFRVSFELLIAGWLNGVPKSIGVDKDLMDSYAAGLVHAIPVQSINKDGCYTRYTFTTYIHI